MAQTQRGAPYLDGWLLVATGDNWQETKLEAGARTFFCTPNAAPARYRARARPRTLTRNFPPHSFQPCEHVLQGIFGSTSVIFDYCVCVSRAVWVTNPPLPQGNGAIQYTATSYIFHLHMYTYENSMLILDLENLDSAL